MSLTQHAYFPKKEPAQPAADLPHVELPPSSPTAWQFLHDAAHDIASRAQRGGETRRQKHAERRAAQGSSIQKPTASRRAQARIDHMRTVAARKGVTATIPPAPAAEPAETVEQWTQRTGCKPEVLPNTFDERITKFPLRRPSMPRFTYHA